jgi:hypothetical protein
MEPVLRAQAKTAASTCGFSTEFVGFTKTRTG